jgi:hypothetical protein
MGIRNVVCLPGTKQAVVFCGAGISSQVDKMINALDALSVAQINNVIFTVSEDDQ